VSTVAWREDGGTCTEPRAVSNVERTLEPVTARDSGRVDVSSVFWLRSSDHYCRLAYVVHDYEFLLQCLSHEINLLTIHPFHCYQTRNGGLHDLRPIQSSGR
jgi:hypothetical protein